MMYQDERDYHGDCLGLGDDMGHWSQEQQYAEPMNLLDEEIWNVLEDIPEEEFSMHGEVLPLHSAGGDLVGEKRHTLPKLQTTISDWASILDSEQFNELSPTLSPTTSPRRANTYPHRLKDLLSKIGDKIEPRAPTSLGSDIDALSVAHDDEVIRKAGCEAWPVPTFLLESSRKWDSPRVTEEPSDIHTNVHLPTTSSFLSGNLCPTAPAGFPNNNGWYTIPEEQGSVAPSAAFETTAEKNPYDYTAYDQKPRGGKAKGRLIPTSDSGIGSSNRSHSNPQQSLMGGSMYGGMHNGSYSRSLLYKEGMLNYRHFCSL